MTRPDVFFQLECGDWNADAEMNGGNLTCLGTNNWTDKPTAEANNDAVFIQTEETPPLRWLVYMPPARKRLLFSVAKVQKIGVGVQ